MKCSFCENQKNLKKTVVNHKYIECGLDNVRLNGIAMFTCQNCKEEYLSYGDISKLHGKIAEVLISKIDVLTGKEIRFLRKHLGYSGAMFAQLVGLAHETLSRIENGKQQVTQSFDRLVRFAVASKTPDRNYELHDLLLNKKGNSSARIELKLDSKGKWVLPKVA